MNLRFRLELASAYKAGPQVSRVLSEDWCARELYCAACDSDRLLPSKTNTPAIDFVCPECRQAYQLKSLRTWNSTKIPDAGYDAMLRAIRTDRTPNLLILQYSDAWLVRNLVLIPRGFFSESILEKRPPLSPRARRAGWVGCNILLSRIPEDGKIAVVSESSPMAEVRVRSEFARVRKLAEVPTTQRGWTVDVIDAIRRLGKSQFSLQQLYTCESELKARHPRNQNVRPKIRQQLQVLRDMGLIEFVTPGTYQLRS